MMNIRRLGFHTLLLLLITADAAHALQEATIRFSPEAPLSPIEAEPGELSVYEAIREQPDDARRLSLINRFLAEYPTSEFRHLALRARWEVRVRGGDPEAIIEAAEDAMAAEEHFQDAKLGFINDPSRIEGVAEFRYAIAHQKAAYYQSIVNAFRQLGDSARVVEYGEAGLEAAVEAWNLYDGVAPEGSSGHATALEQNHEIQAFILFSLVEVYENAGNIAKVVDSYERILGLNPNDLQTLMTTSRLMAERPLPVGAEPEDYLERAQGYARRALDQLDVYFSGTSAASFDGGRKAALTGEIQYTLGLIYLRLEDWENVAAAARAAIEAFPGEAEFYTMLGFAARQLRDVPGFLSAYARAVYLGTPRPEVRSDLETIYAAANGSLDGLEDFIAAEGSDIEVGNAIARSPERTAYIEDVIDRIEVLPTVFPPNRFCYQYYEFLAGQDLSWAQDALEIGVGSGVNSLIVLDQGVGRLVGTDINENAVRTFELNAEAFGHSDRVDVRLVPINRPEAFSVIRDDEKFDLVISNPPWEASTEPQQISEYAYLDSGWVLLRSMLAGLPDHLKDDGKVWLLYGDPRVTPAPVPPAVQIILAEAPAHGLAINMIHSNARCSIVELTVDDSVRPAVP